MPSPNELVPNCRLANRIMSVSNPRVPQKRGSGFGRQTCLRCPFFPCTPPVGVGRGEFHGRGQVEEGGYRVEKPPGSCDEKSRGR